MKSKKLAIFRNVFANIVIVAIIVALGCFAFLGSGLELSTTASSNGAYYYGNRGEAKVAIMFNVYSGTEYIDGIIDLLTKNGAKSTFFVGGVWVEKHPNVLKNIVEKGMEIGNHGYLHRDSDQLSDDGLKQEIKLAENLIFAHVNLKTTLFAPPSGAVNKNVTKIAESIGYQTIMWSKDTIDWRDQDVGLIVKRATTDVSSGDLILMHPTKASLEALPQIISKLTDNGYVLTTVSDVISPTSA